MSHRFIGQRSARPPGTGARATGPVLAALAAGTLLALPAGAHAQSPAGATRSGAAPATLAPVVVTATRQPTRVDEQLGEVTIIDRADIERAAGRTLPELLALQPGVQMNATGGRGSVSGVFLRGMETRHTLVLVDGVRYGSATLGTPNLDNLPLELIERIEIVRGPLSGLYGSDAVAGVIQIFTRRGEQGFFPNATATIGSNRLSELGVGFRAGSGPWDLALQVQGTETEGFSATNSRVPFGNFNPDRDGFRQTSGSLNAGYRFNADWRARASVLRSESTAGFDDGLGANARRKLVTDVATLGLEGRVTQSWQTALRVARSEDVTDGQTAAAAFNLGRFSTRQTQVGWENRIATPVGSLLLLTETLEQSVSRPGTPYRVTSRNIDSVAAGLNGTSGAHVWQGNVRRDRNSQFGGQDTGSLGYGYNVTQQLRIAASAGTSFVAPSFNQLYFPGFGNPLLQPEEGRHNELSVRYADHGHELRIAQFQNRIRGFITPGPLPVNIPSSSIDGWTVTYGGRIGAWTLGATLETVDPRDNATQRLLPRRARNTAKLNADVELGQWRLGTSVLAVDRRFENTANTIEMGAFLLVDLRADRRITRGWTLGLRVNNATDRNYETAFGYLQPRREFFLTLRYAPG
jgi:vitamin B12 transporter